MSCKRTRNLIQTVADGSASPADAEAVRTHVAGCPPCAEDLRQSELLLRALGAVPRREVSQGFEHRLMAAVASSEKSSPLAAWWERFCVAFEWRLRLPTTVAAASLAAACIAAVVMPRVSEYGERQQERQSFVAVAVQEHRVLERVQSERSSEAFDAVHASLDLSAGNVVTE